MMMKLSDEFKIKHLQFILKYWGTLSILSWFSPRWNKKTAFKPALLTFVSPLRHFFVVKANSV